MTANSLFFSSCSPALRACCDPGIGAGKGAGMGISRVWFSTVYAKEKVESLDDSNGGGGGLCIKGRDVCEVSDRAEEPLSVSSEATRLLPVRAPRLPRSRMAAAGLWRADVLVRGVIPTGMNERTGSGGEVRARVERKKAKGGARIVLTTTLA